MSRIKKIGIVGFGHMGQAIFNILKKEKNCRFFIHSRNLTSVAGAKCPRNMEELFEKSDLVFLCIKPQDFRSLEAIKSKNQKNMFISVMAGVKIASLEKRLETRRIIRTMPNLALEIGQAVIGCHINKKYFSNAEQGKIKDILSNFGRIIYLEKEGMLDNLTAVSGSGPAYVFLFMDALTRAAQNLGFDKRQALGIVRQTISGSLGYLDKRQVHDMKKLIDKVASKGGTTEAALNQINMQGFYDIWQKAIKKAASRAKELSI